MGQHLQAEGAMRPTTHLFMVRLWQVSTDHGQPEIRGKVQHVLSGEVRYFGDWPSLRTFLIAQSAEEDESASD